MNEMTASETQIFPTAFERYNEVIKAIFQHVGNLVNCSFIYVIGNVAIQNHKTNDSSGPGAIIIVFSIVLAVLNSISFLWVHWNFWSDLYQKYNFPKRANRRSGMLVINVLYISLTVTLFIVGAKIRFPT
jgi:hypothetical protein